MELVRIAEALSEALSPLTFAPPVTHTYNPLDYAWEPHANYLTRYGQAPREVVMFGMNPGPWGMAQTGVPFGEISLVRDWLGVEGVVYEPDMEHPKRPIEGWECERSEVSGRRLWGWIRDTFGTPEAFFSRFFIYNYCPLSFLEESGRNRTPDRLKANERKTLFPLCDQALRETIEYLQPSVVCGIGAFAHGRAKIALEGLDLTIGRLPHPSPASPQANKGWAPLMEKALDELGIALPTAPATAQDQVTAPTSASQETSS